MITDYKTPKKSLAIFGTGSDVGKSVIATGFCRYYANKAFNVAPFKAQNMSNNSGVTPDGLEMGRAQIVQAEAAKIAPHVDMNPILLKPTDDFRSQLVLLGKAIETNDAKAYYQKKENLFSLVCSAYNRLRSIYDKIIIEGAGSCAEVNLADNDIVNFRMAEYADAPIILIADINRGGVFAQIVGTLSCLDKSQQDRIIGFIINKFRGDISLFDGGIKWLENKTGKPIFGVVPCFDRINIQQEDSVVLENISDNTNLNLAFQDRSSKGPGISQGIGIIKIPHISNFTDFDPFGFIPDLRVCYLEKPVDLSSFNAVIIPGSKNSRSDLEWLKTTGWASRIFDYYKNSGFIFGICGGYQILGQSIDDPFALEGPAGKSQGLGLLPVVTILQEPKTTVLTEFIWNGQKGLGYEIHMGQTIRHGGKPLISIKSKDRINTEDGCLDINGKVMGTYIHGFFDYGDILKSFLDMIRVHVTNPIVRCGLEMRNLQYDLLEDHIKRYVDMNRIDSMT